MFASLSNFADTNWRQRTQSKVQRGVILALTAFSFCVPLTPVFAAVKTVVLVHGAFADGSGWKSVTDILRHDGYKILVVQQPETTYADDVAATKRVLAAAGPCVLVGHSYGGSVITEAGTHDSARVLVYVAAFAPDVGESAGSLNSKTPALAKSIGPVGDGFLQVDPASFHADFAADLPAATAEFMAFSQVPISMEAFGGSPKVAAWKSKPVFGVVAKDDHMINPDLERSMYSRAKATITELPGSHALYISHAKEVAAVIEKAAKAAE